jgi:hypothetical protein
MQEAYECKFAGSAELLVCMLKYSLVSLAALPPSPALHAFSALSWTVG